jgi:hypothetical protein
VAREKTYINEELTLAVEEMRQRPPGRKWRHQRNANADSVSPATTVYLVKSGEDQPLPDIDEVGIGDPAGSGYRPI